MIMTEQTLHLSKMFMWVRSGKSASQVFDKLMRKQKYNQANGRLMRAMFEVKFRIKCIQLLIIKHFIKIRTKL